MSADWRAIFGGLGFDTKHRFFLLRQTIFCAISLSDVVLDYDAFIKGKNLDKNVNFVLKNGDTVFVKE